MNAKVRSSTGEIFEGKIIRSHRENLRLVRVQWTPRAHGYYVQHLARGRWRTLELWDYFSNAIRHWRAAVSGMDFEGHKASEITGETQ